MPVHPIIIHLKEKLKENIENCHKSFLYFVSIGKQRADDLLREISFEELYEEFISKLNILEFINYLYSNNFLLLIDEFRNIWTKFLNETKRIVNKKFKNECKHPYLYKKKDFLKFIDIYTPIKMIRKMENDSIEHSNDLEFIKSIKGEQEKILIQGDCGMGKTFQFYYFLHRWACDENLFSDYVVLHLELNKLKEDENLNEGLFNQNFRSTGSWVQKELFYYYLSNDCDDSYRKIIILIDGIENSTEKKSSRILEQVKSTITQTVHSIIVWSRTEKSLLLQSVFDYHYEIKGFTMENLIKFFEKYLQKSYKQQSLTTVLSIGEETSIVEYLWRTNKKLLYDCQNPLFAHLTINAWIKAGYNLNNFQAKIYKTFIKFIIKKQAISKLSFKIYKEFCLKLAFDNILTGKPILLEKNWNENFPYLRGILFPFQKDRKGNEELRFTYLSIQEYLTSVFIINEFAKGNIEIQQNFKNCEKPFLLKNSLNFMKETSPDIYELIIDKKISEKNGSLDMDLQSLLHEKLKVLSINLFGLDLSLPFLKTLMVCSMNNICSINLCWIKLELPKFMTAVCEGLNNVLEELILETIINDELDINDLEDIEHLEKLKILHLSNILLNKKDEDDEFKIISPSLKSLAILNCNTKCLNFNGDFKINCQNLNLFSFSQEFLSCDTVTEIFDILQETDVTRLHFKNCNFTIDQEFLDGLKNFSMLEEIVINNLLINDEAGVNIMKCLYENHDSLQKLNLNYCKFELNSIYLSNLLQGFHNLSSLELLDIRIVEDEHLPFFCQIFNLMTLKVFKISEICVKTEKTGNEAHYLTDVYEKNDNLSLEFLEMEHIDLSHKLLYNATLKLIQNSKGLRVLKLGYLPLEKNELQILIDTVITLKELSIVHLNFNNIDNETLSLIDSLYKIDNYRKLQVNYIERNLSQKLCLDFGYQNRNHIINMQSTSNLFNFPIDFFIKLFQLDEIPFISSQSVFLNRLQELLSQYMKNNYQNMSFQENLAYFYEKLSHLKNDTHITFESESISFETEQDFLFLVTFIVKEINKLSLISSSALDRMNIHAKAINRPESKILNQQQPSINTENSTNVFNIENQQIFAIRAFQQFSPNNFLKILLESNVQIESFEIDDCLFERNSYYYVIELLKKQQNLHNITIILRDNPEEFNEKTWKIIEYLTVNLYEKSLSKSNSLEHINLIHSQINDEPNYLNTEMNNNYFDLINDFDKANVFILDNKPNDSKRELNCQENKNREDAIYSFYLYINRILNENRRLLSFKLGKHFLTHIHSEIIFNVSESQSSSHDLKEKNYENIENEKPSKYQKLHQVSMCMDEF